MRILTILAVAAAPALLASCSPPVDDPANTPQLGAWKQTAMVNSVGMNGMNYGRASLSDQGGDVLLRTLEREQRKSCFEPTFREPRQLKALIPDKFGDCEVADSQTEGDTRSATLECKDASSGRQFDSARITLNGDLAAEEVTLNIVIDASKLQTSGNTESQSVNLTQTWTRTGNCG